jgi:DNA-binding MarR family transcriptional regulator
MTTAVERAWKALAEIHAALVQRVDRETQAAAGLPASWFDLLLELESANAPLRITALAERVTLSRTRVSRLVDEMVRAGLVDREANPDDGRSSFASLSKVGRARLEKAAPAHRATVADAMSGSLTGAEIQQLADLLEKLNTGSELDPRR